MPEEQHILESWVANSSQWVETVQRGEIESRALATNAAIVEAIVAGDPGSLLDVGCGEGWLCREISSHGILSSGVDGVPELIRNASATGGGEFFAQSYEDIIEHGLLTDTRYDVIVFNFSLFGEQSTADLINRLKPHLAKGGRFLIHTLHPEHPAVSDQSVSGWRTESWGGMKREYALPYQWYFRTFDGWYVLFEECGLNLTETRIIKNPNSGEPISAVFVLQIG
jgi:cyclopropane fatty-acyl-phospholipid synthase-like methyltransferase